MNLFKLAEHRTNVQQEINAGVTTFLSMLYIVPTNAFILSQAGMPMEAVLSVTAFMTALACVLNGLWSNTPIAISTGMGLNSYFVFALVLGQGIAWQTALGVVFLSGLMFFVLSATPFRRWLVHSIPLDLCRAISAGIGAFIAFVGLQQMQLIVADDVTLVKAGNLNTPDALLAIFGLALVALFSAWRVKGGFILAILMSSMLAWSLGLAPYPQEFMAWPAAMTPILFELDIKAAFSLALLPAIIAFVMVDLFDSLGTLAGVGNRAGLFDENNNGAVKLTRTLQVDSAASVIGALMGVSTMTSFAESATGVEEGGRTGLTAVVTGLLFLLPLFCLPWLVSIPGNAVYPVLVMVGVLMFAEIGKIDFSDFATAFASFLIVLLIPLSYSIGNGLAAGFVAYVAVRLCKKENDQLSPGLFLIALLSLVFLFA